MKKSERALLIVCAPAAAGEAKLGLHEVKADRVVFTLELVDFQKGQDILTMSEEEKIEFGSAQKEVGTMLFKCHRFYMALRKYRKVADMFGGAVNFQAEHKSKAMELKLACDLNRAACLLKLGDYAEAKVACNAAFEQDTLNLKAFYRRAQAERGLKNLAGCVSDCKQVLALDPHNKEVLSVLQLALRDQGVVDMKVAEKPLVPWCERAADFAVAYAEENDDPDVDDDAYETWLLEQQLQTLEKKYG